MLVSGKERGIELAIRNCHNDFFQRRVDQIEVPADRGLSQHCPRYRHRVWRQGFIVARHDDLAHIEGERCVLALEKSKISPRRPGEKRVGIGPGLSGLVPD